MSVDGAKRVIETSMEEFAISNCLNELFGSTDTYRGFALSFKLCSYSSVAKVHVATLMC